MISEAESKSYEFEGFRVDPAKRLLFGAGGEPVSLTPKVFDTLLYLVRHSGELIEKEQLMSAIWTDTIVEENNLNKNISVLRRVLGEHPDEHRFIVTVPGKGYKFVAPVNEQANGGVSASAAGVASATEYRDLSLGIGQEEASNHTGRATGHERTSRFWFFAIMLVICLGLGLLGFYSWREVPTDAPIKSVAVLPFVNVGGDEELEYLSDGLSENLIDRLSELTQLKVISRSSSFKYRNENEDLQDVAQKLGVQAIVTGKVTRRGDDLNIRVELIDALDNKQLWGGQFSRKATDVLAIEGEIARTVSDKLRVKLSGEQEQQLAKSSTANIEAHDLVLKGDFAARKSATRPKAIEYYQQAVASDPNHALAYARLALTYQSLSAGNFLDPKETLPKIQAAARKAIELDENLADAHVVLANLARDRWDWTTSEDEYRRALELNPNLVAAHHRYSSYLSDVGRHEQAIAEARLLKELDPQRVVSHMAVPSALLLARRSDEAIVEIRKTLELDPTYGGYALLGHAYTGKGMYDEAITAYKEAIRRGGNQSYQMICLGAAYARAGQGEKARAILAQMEKSKEYISPGELPILYAAMGEREKAFAMLERAYAARDLQLQHLNSDPGFDPLRDDPRFEDLVRRIGLSR